MKIVEPIYNSKYMDKVLECWCRNRKGGEGFLTMGWKRGPAANKGVFVQDRAHFGSMIGDAKIKLSSSQREIMQVKSMLVDFDRPANSSFHNEMHANFAQFHPGNIIQNMVDRDQTELGAGHWCY